MPADTSRRDVALLRLAIVAADVQQVIDQRAAQPAEQFLFRTAAKVGKVLLRLHERFLYEVGRADLALQIAPQPRPATSSR